MQPISIPHCPLVQPDISGLEGKVQCESQSSFCASWGFENPNDSETESQKGDMKSFIIVSPCIHQHDANFQASGFGAMCVPVGYPIVTLAGWLSKSILSEILFL